MKKLLQALFALLIGAMIYCSGCSPLRRAEREIVGNIPGVERVEWTITGEAIGPAGMVCTGEGDTLADAIEDIGCKSSRPDEEN